MAKKNNSNVSGLVLFAKRPDRTSFQSLSIIKKSLETSKVGHTGTLDSFAQGLLVVCVGNLTRLASHITAFDKSYEAVIKFGSETDTLDFTGHVTKHANLPTLENLLKSLKKFSGQIEQTPPVFSALKIDGERASDLIRKGKNVELQKRAITVHSSQIVEIKFDDNLLYDFSNLELNQDNLKKYVSYVKIKFDVSKGTYIRCLARDIAIDCNSCAHLIGLLRTKVGCFSLEDSVGNNFLNDFSINSVIKQVEESKINVLQFDKNISENKKLIQKDSNMDIVSSEIKKKILQMNPSIAIACGLKPVFIKDEFEKDFSNGKFLKSKMFLQSEFENIKYSVFNSNQRFLGVIQHIDNKFLYEYVIPQ